MSEQEAEQAKNEENKPTVEEDAGAEEEDETSAAAGEGGAVESKNARKRREKEEKKAEAKRAKEEAKKAKEAETGGEKESGKSKAGAAAEEILDPSKYFENRCKLLDAWTECKTKYPHKFAITHQLPQLVAIYEQNKAAPGAEVRNLAPDERDKEEVRVAGRLMGKRESGSKLVFYTLQAEGAHIQILSSLQDWAGPQESFETTHAALRRGDIVGVTGVVGRAKRGELSILPTNIALLSPCLHMLPQPKLGSTKMLTDPETRFRKRHLDLILNPHVRDIFCTRSKIINYVRRFLDMRGFLEVETPMMAVLAGGAAAAPFVTHHNDLGIDMFLRVAPELYLKKLVIGGLDRVYEIGKQFRNESIDLTHNPEFTTCEFYEAYADYHDLIERTEQMISGMVKEITGSYVITFQESWGMDKSGHDDDEKEFKGRTHVIDFSPPWKRVSMLDGLKTAAGIDIPGGAQNLGSEEARAYLDEQCKKFGVDCSFPRTTTRLLDKLVGHFLESQFINPTFLMDHPVVMSPLAKEHRDIPGLTERFELFVAGKELCNAYTELNNPHIQRERFVEQVKDKKSGDGEAMPYDEGFCEALEYGLPPTGGWGLGIDRLTMFLTNNESIREVLLFPAMKLEKQGGGASASTQHADRPVAKGPSQTTMTAIGEALETVLEKSKSPFIGGALPTKEDSTKFSELTTFEGLGPKGLAWAQTVSLFSPALRDQWA